MKDTHYLAFTSEWFAKHQKILLWVFNLVYKLCPSILFKSKETDDFGKNKIIEAGNNHATCDAGLQYFKKSALYETASKNPENNHRTRRIYKKLLKKVLQGKIKEELKLLPARKTVFFTDWNYSKMLYNAFKPMWWVMHWWDEFFADKWVPQLSFGFSTLEVNPGSIGTDNPVDGYVSKSTNNQTWAGIRDAAGNNNDKTDTTLLVQIGAGTNSNTWYSIYRAIFLFDTSSLTAGATISAAVISLYGSSKVDTLAASPNINIYTSTPASNTSLANGDYAQVGSTAQCDTVITYANWSTVGYNDFTFNATGIGNVSKTSISKFGARNANYDVANTAPTWASGTAWFQIKCYASNNDSNKPKLVVTYTANQNLTWSGDDTVSMTESNSNSRSRVSSINDTVRLTESNSNSRQRVVSLADTIQLTESINAIKVFIISVIDYIKLTENKFFSLKFDGVNDYVSINDPVLGSTAMTVCAWVKKKSYVQYQGIVADYQPVNGSKNFILGYENPEGKITFYVGDGINIDSIPITDFNANVWHFVCGVFDGDTDTLKIYLDGNVASKVTTINNIGNSQSSYSQIGKYSSSYPFSGSIDDVRIYNRALSPAEVLASYLGQYVDPTGLVLDMPFDGDALDHSGNNNNGTIYGAVWIPKIPTLIRARFASLFDTINLTEVSTNLKLGVISVFDTINLTEVSTNLRERFISLIDTINLTEVNTNIRARFASLVDTINLTEVSTNLKSGVISVFDTIGITETFRADMMRLCKGMLRMDSKQQSYPNTLNDTGINKMKSNQQSYPVPMDEDVK